MLSYHGKSLFHLLGLLAHPKLDPLPVKQLPFIVLSSEDVGAYLMVENSFDGLFSIFYRHPDYYYGAAGREFDPGARDAALFKFQFDLFIQSHRLQVHCKSLYRLLSSQHGPSTFFDNAFVFLAVVLQYRQSLAQQTPIQLVLFCMQLMSVLEQRIDLIPLVEEESALFV